MARLSFYASLRNLVDHLAPLWWALPTELRGPFRVADKSLVAYCAEAWDMPTLRERPPAAPHVVASYADELLVARVGGSVALLEHGSGQFYGGFDASSTLSDRRPSVELYMAPSPEVADRMAAVLPRAERVWVGCPRLDPFVGQPRDPDGPIGLAWHWNAGSRWPEARSGFAHYGPYLRELSSAFPGRIWGHAHPRLFGSVHNLYSLAGITPVPDSRMVLDSVSVLSADNTSLMWEAAALDIPLVILDAPWFRRDVWHGLRFWDFADVGPRISDPAGWADAIRAAPDPAWTPLRRAAAAAIYGPIDGLATARALEALRSWSGRISEKYPVST